MRILGTALAVMAVLWLSQALARNDGRYDNADPDLRAWVEALTNKHGISCCADAEGRTVEWTIDEDGYRVLVDGEWLRVPDEAVLRNTHNRLGGARVWLYWTFQGGFRGYPVIRCFLPGAET